jgi:hypothetical protein
LFAVHALKEDKIIVFERKVIRAIFGLEREE